ncbi:MAG: hypothetical protein JNL32_01530 [Candidatus Kapabacteria bacterium]|nr:hypothetical protein [Candidatus Kapabacteria bacterium]
MKTLSLFAICALFILAGCESPVEYTADQLTLAQFNTEPGYSWFPAEVRKYQPDTAKVAAIRAAFKANPVTTAIFVSPSCTCVGTQKNFPHLISTLRAAGIPDSTVTVYTMKNAQTKHALQDRVTVSSLPTFYFMRGTTGKMMVPKSDTTYRVEPDILIALQ